MKSNALHDAGRIMVVDDDPNIRNLLSQRLSLMGHEVRVAQGSQEALAIFEQFFPDVVLLDVHLGTENGIELLSQWIKLFPAIRFIMISGEATITSAVKALALGADDFIEKPVNIDILQNRLERSLENKRLTLLREVDPNAGKWIGSSDVSVKLMRESDKLGQADMSIHIVGPVGSGKKAMARRLHHLSGRMNFVSYNCGLWDEANGEKLLFGYVKENEQGAAQFHPGALQIAHGGTLFLEGVEAMPLGLQKRLAVALREGMVPPVGGTEAARVDTRILSASTDNLQDQVSQNEFNSELLVELAAATIHIPPLNERKEDLTELIEYFTKKLMKSSSRRLTFDKDSMKALNHYPWPGNARELLQVLERVNLIAHGEVTLDDLPEEVLREYLLRSESQNAAHDESSPAVPDDVTWKEYRRLTDRVFVSRVLDRNNGNVTKAAKQLNVKRETVHRWINELGLRKDKKEKAS